MRLIIIVFLAVFVGAQQPVQAPPESINATVLVRELGHREFEQRDKATTALKALGAAAKSALEEGAKSSNLEVSTRCKMLLKELGGDAPQPLREIEAEAPAPASDADAFPRMEDFKNVHEFIQAWQKRNDAMLKRLLDDHERFPLPSHRFEFKAGPQGSSKSVQVRDGERVEVDQKDGSVRVQIQKLDAAGSPQGEPQTFEAASEEEFRAKYPEVAKAHLTEAPLRFDGFRAGPLRGRSSARPVLPLQPLPPELQRSSPLLGITMEAASNDLCEHVDVPLGTQRITTVQAGSLAERIGVKPQDLLLALDGVAIKDVADVRAGMAATQAPAEIQVEVVRKGVRMTLKGLRKP